MSGKRAKPSPWRFLRAAPVVVVAVVVWVLVGVFLVLPDSGTDQAHGWGTDPIPSSSVEEVPTDADSSSAGSPEPSTPSTSTARDSTTSPDGPARERTPAGDLELTGASVPGPTTQPRRRPTSDPTAPAPTQPASGHGADDNPGKAKGHDKPHGPPGDQH